MGLHYSCQGQWFERVTEYIMHTYIWPIPTRSVKIKLSNISDCGIKKHLCRHLFKYLLSDAISERSKGNFVCFSVSFLLVMMIAQTLLPERAKQSSIFQLKRSDSHFLSVVQRLCFPHFSLSFTLSCFR